MVRRIESGVGSGVGSGVDVCTGLTNLNNLVLHSLFLACTTAHLSEAVDASPDIVNLIFLLIA